MQIYTHTHTHTHTYIYIYVYVRTHAVRKSFCEYPRVCALSIRGSWHVRLGIQHTRPQHAPPPEEALTHSDMSAGGRREADSASRARQARPHMGRRRATHTHTHTHTHTRPHTHTSTHTHMHTYKRQHADRGLLSASRVPAMAGKTLDRVGHTASPVQWPVCGCVHVCVQTGNPVTRDCVSLCGSFDPVLADTAVAPITHSCPPYIGRP